MIGYLRGLVLDKEAGEIVVDVHGVGYRVSLSLNSMASVPEIGGPIQLRIHTHVREDALTLIGFVTAEEEQLFHHLISASGVGPRLALNILSGMPPAEIAYALAHKEIARLTKISGVGKKTAERLIVELSDKLKASPLLLIKGGPAPKRGTPSDDLVSALSNLGYRPADAERAASAAREQLPDAPIEALVRAALQILASKPG